MAGYPVGISSVVQGREQAGLLQSRTGGAVGSVPGGIAGFLFPLRFTVVSSFRTLSPRVIRCSLDMFSNLVRWDSVQWAPVGTRTPARLGAAPGAAPCSCHLPTSKPPPGVQASGGEKPPLPGGLGFLLDTEVPLLPLGCSVSAAFQHACVCTQASRESRDQEDEVYCVQERAH